MNNFFLVTSIDPTRTLTIRNKFVSAMRKRFSSLMVDIKQALVDQDVMGLDTTNKPLKFNASNLSPRQFNFPTSAQKVEAFTKWINEQAKKYLLSNGREGINIVSGEVGNARESWIKLYIDSAYQQGIRRARQELKKKGVDIDDGSLGGDPIRVAFNNLVHADRVGLIYSRAYSSLKSITAEMDSIVSDVLALGIADGRGPKQIARMLDKVITGRGESLEILDSLGRKIPSLRRAEILARTEVIRSHHSANIGEYRAAGALGITVLAEHLTAGDDRVCPKCAPLNGKQYTIEEAEYIIPVHPQCRCVAIPYIPEDSLGRQVVPKVDDFYEQRADSLNSLLTKEEKKAIENYTGSEYLKVNGELREKFGKLGYIEDTSVRKMVRELDSVLTKSIPLDSDLMVYRGIEEFEEVFPNGISIGDSITDHGFVSTSMNKDMAKRFTGPGGYLFQINLKAGTKAGFILKESNAREVLLPRYTNGSDKNKFKIVNIDEANKTITAEWEN